MKVGQRVKLIGYSSKQPDKYNPRDCAGTIKSLDGEHNPIIVLWDNGMQNSYHERDLQTIYQSKNVL